MLDSLWPVDTFPTPSGWPNDLMVRDDCDSNIQTEIIQREEFVPHKCFWPFQNKTLLVRRGKQTNYRFTLLPQGMNIWRRAGGVPLPPPICSSLGTHPFVCTPHRRSSLERGGRGKEREDWASAAEYNISSCSQDLCCIDDCLKWNP